MIASSMRMNKKRLSCTNSEESFLRTHPFLQIIGPNQSAASEKDGPRNFVELSCDFRIGGQSFVHKVQAEDANWDEEAKRLKAAAAGPGLRERRNALTNHDSLPKKFTQTS
jgi:hypothetical protein